MESISDIMNFDPSTLKHFINKKTQRGRKIKCPLPKVPRCCICLEFEEYSKEKLISCSVCKAMIHPSCYHRKLSEDDKFSFTCERCMNAIKEKKEVESYKCFICDECDGILKKNFETGEYYHSVCLKLIPEIANEDEENITRNNIRKWRYKNSCKYCQSRLSKSKAVIKCSNPKCKDYYHIPCAIEKGMLFSINYMIKYYSTIEMECDGNALPFYCSCHNKRLASCYRKDVIYEDNLENFDLGERRPSITTEDENSSTTNENFSVLGKSELPTCHGFSTYQTCSTCSDEGDEGSFKRETDFENGYGYDINRNSVMYLDFDAIKFEKGELPEQMPINDSPKEAIPLDFIYEKF
ncbi:MAG: hypothetical protein MJ252_30320 [archaeon]|nr:hypothetical protein [archaeon]